MSAIRRATADDVPALTQLARLEAAVISNPTEWDHRICGTLVWQDDNDLVRGFIWFENVFVRDWLCINSVVVDSAMRGKGIGASLVNDVCAAVKRGGAPLVHGLCPPNRRGFWQRAGFTVQEAGQPWTMPAFNLYGSAVVLEVEPGMCAMWRSTAD